MIGHDCLTTVIDVNVADGLLAGLVELRQCLKSRAAVALSLERQPPVGFGSANLFAEVESSPPRQFSEHAVQRDRL